MLTMEAEVTLAEVESVGYLPGVSDPNVPGANFYEDVPLEWLSVHRDHKREAGSARPRIVFLGDSITEGWCGSGKTGWDRSFAPYGASNFGKGGDKAQHLVWRLRDGLLAEAKPEVLVAMIGVNNLWYDADQFAIQAVADAVVRVGSHLRTTHPGAAILQLSVLPALADPDRGPPAR